MLSKNNLTVIIFLVLTFLIFTLSWKDTIIFTDEILFEEAAYQMHKTGDFLTPRLEGEVWLEKPPLYFWLTAIIYRLAAPTPFTRRLVTLLSAAATVALTYRLAKYFYKEEVARWSMILLVDSPLFFFFTKTANLDIVATLFTTASILLYLKAKTRPRWLLLSGVSLGLAILTRSFLGLTALPVILIDQLLAKKKRLPMRLLLTSLLTAFLIAAPWHLYVLNRYPQIFLHEYLRFNLLQHLLSQTPGYEPLSASRFLFNVLFVFNPLALLALANLLSKNPPGNQRPQPVLAIWITSSLIPLTLAATRHEWYAIQALPPVAILSSLGLSRLRRELKARTSVLFRLFFLSLLLTFPTVVFLNLPKETKSVIMLKKFIQNTPPGTPLYNLEYKFIPQSSLYNPREVIVLLPDALDKLNRPIYLYLESPEQYSQAKTHLETCCQHQIILTYQNAVILSIKPK